MNYPLFRVTLSLCIATMSFGVCAQTSEAVPSTTSEAASNVTAMSAKDARSANRKLQRDVFRVLQRTKGLVSTSIAVKASDGAVTLEGAVPEESQMALATRAAEGVPGVKSVRNMLTLSQF
jgi:hyperosmotically inducible periplasmic protein